jgi:hypothetical protein
MMIRIQGKAYFISKQLTWQLGAFIRLSIACCQNIFQLAWNIFQIQRLTNKS